jgi:hypothetical protein
MTQITFPNTTSTIDDIRQAIGRSVIFYLEDKSDCPTCEIDPVTNESKDPFCPTCSGIGYLITYSGLSTIAHINWGGMDDLNWVSGGQFFNGDCRIQIKYTEENISAVDNAIYVLVDGKKMSVDKKTFRGAQELNRIIVDLNEKE